MYNFQKLVYIGFLGFCLLFSFGCTRGYQTDTGAATRRDARDVVTAETDKAVFVLGKDGNLWVEPRGYLDCGGTLCAPPRLLQDRNVKSFAPLDNGQVLVLSSGDAKLWLEPVGWLRCEVYTGGASECGGFQRFLQDANVETFAPNGERVLVLGGNGKLWNEPYRFLDCGGLTTETTACGKQRALQDGQDFPVIEFQAGVQIQRQGAGYVESPFVLVLGSDGILWLEQPDFNFCQGNLPPQGDAHSSPCGGLVRSKQDVAVHDFRLGGNRRLNPYVAVLGRSGALTVQGLGYADAAGTVAQWQGNDVRSFEIANPVSGDPSKDFLLVRDTTDTLYVQGIGNPGTRIRQESDVQQFALLPHSAASGYRIYVRTSDGLVWDEELGFRECGASNDYSRTSCGHRRQLQDANVAAFRFSEEPRPTPH